MSKADKARYVVKARFPAPGQGLMDVPIWLISRHEVGPRGLAHARKKARFWIADYQVRYGADAPHQVWIVLRLGIREIVQEAWGEPLPQEMWERGET